MSMQYPVRIGHMVTGVDSNFDEGVGGFGGGGGMVVISLVSKNNERQLTCVT